MPKLSFQWFDHSCLVLRQEKVPQQCARLGFSNSTSAHEVGLSPTGFLPSMTHFKFIANYLEQSFINRKCHAPVNMTYKRLPVAQNDDVDTSSDLDISKIDF